MSKKNESKLAEHIRKCPYDIKKRIYKILVEGERKVLGVVRLLAGGSKSLRYELWADYMQMNSLGKILSQLGYYQLKLFESHLKAVLRELQESIGHRDDMTRWSYTNLSEADRQDIRGSLLNIIESSTHAVFIFNERNLYEYCKRLPCSKFGYIPWGAFKLDIIHMLLDYVLHYRTFYSTFFYTHVADGIYTHCIKPDFSSFEYDYDNPPASDGTEIITCARLRDHALPLEMNLSDVEFYELMPTPIDYGYIWKEFFLWPFRRSLDLHQKILETEKRPVYHICRRKELNSKKPFGTLATRNYFSGDEKAFEVVRTDYSAYLESLFETKSIFKRT